MTAFFNNNIVAARAEKIWTSASTELATKMIYHKAWLRYLFFRETQQKLDFSADPVPIYNGQFNVTRLVTITDLM